MQISSDKCSTEIIFYWWDDSIGLQARSRINKKTREKYFLTSWKNENNGTCIGQCIFHLREQIRKHGEPGKTYVDGLNTESITRWFKTDPKVHKGTNYDGNVVYDALCQGHEWFRNKNCTNFDHCKRLIHKYKFEKECHVYIWTDYIALELSDKEYYHFKSDFVKCAKITSHACSKSPREDMNYLGEPTRVDVDRNNEEKLKSMHTSVCNSAKITPQAWSKSLQEDVSNFGKPTRIVGVGVLNEKKLKKEVDFIKNNQVTWHADKMNCCTFVHNMLCSFSNWYKIYNNKQGNVKIKDVSQLVYKRQACTLYLWSSDNIMAGKRMHLSLQLPNGEYISHYPDGRKKQIAKNAMRGLPGKRYVSFKHEVSLKKPPDEVLTMLHVPFDIEAMTNYWFSFKDRKPDWNIRDKSCCRVVYNVLGKGSKSFCGRINGLMKPYDVMQLAKAVEYDLAHMDESFAPLRFLFCLIGYCFRLALLLYLCYNDL